MGCASRRFSRRLDIPNGPLPDSAALESLLRAAARAAGATVLGSHFHHFGAGGGVTGVVLLAESHMSLIPGPRAASLPRIFSCAVTPIR